jgi:hypothetical protein
VVRACHPADWVRYAVEAALVIAVIAIGKMVCDARRRRGTTAP